MKAAGTVEPALQNKSYNKDTVIRFSEGLIGCAERREFVLVENHNILPFRLLEDATSMQVSFVVLDPRVRIPDYFKQIPAREWQSVGISDPTKGFALVVVNMGIDPKDSTANFQAPLLINYERMIGRQVILSDALFCLRQSIFG